MTVVLSSLSIVFLTGSALLLVAGVGHIRHHHAFLTTLTSHGLLPRRLVRSSSWCVAGAELTVGCWGAFAVVAWQFDGGLSVAAALAQAGLYLLLLGYLVVLARLRPGADCGCFHPGTPVNVLLVGRAASLAAVALAFPLFATTEAVGASLTGPQLAAGWLCSAALLAVLSVVSHVPARPVGPAVKVG